MWGSISKTSGFKAAVSTRASAKLVAVPITSIPSSFLSNCLMAERMTSLPSTNSTFIDITASGLTESDVSSIGLLGGRILEQIGRRQWCHQSSLKDVRFCTHYWWCRCGVCGGEKEKRERFHVLSLTRTIGLGHLVSGTYLR